MSRRSQEKLERTRQENVWVRKSLGKAHEKKRKRKGHGLGKDNMRKGIF